MKDCLDKHTIQKYLAGSLSASEKELAESHMQSCEMCRDAVEGLALLPDFSVVDDLEKEVHERFSSSKAKVIPLFTPLRAAASLIILAAASTVVYLLLLKDSGNQLVHEETRVKSHGIESAPPPAFEALEEESEAQEIPMDEPNVLSEEIKTEQPELDVTREISEPAPTRLEKQADLKEERTTVAGNTSVDETIVQDQFASAAEEIETEVQQPVSTQVYRQSVDLDDSGSSATGAARAESRQTNTAKKSNRNKAEQSAPAAADREETFTLKEAEKADIPKIPSETLLAESADKLSKGDTTAILALEKLARSADSPVNSKASLKLAEYYLSVGEKDKARFHLNRINERGNPCRSEAKELLRKL